MATPIDQEDLIDFGSFERHTRGIGFKLLHTMGYKAGEGLGRINNGILNPIIVKLRPKNEGLGWKNNLSKRNKKTLTNKSKSR